MFFLLSLGFVRATEACCMFSRLNIATNWSMLFLIYLLRGLCQLELLDFERLRLLERAVRI
jgi:hypothetical protein